MSVLADTAAQQMQGTYYLWYIKWYGMSHSSPFHFKMELLETNIDNRMEWMICSVIKKEGKFFFFFQIQYIVCLFKMYFILFSLDVLILFSLDAKTCVFVTELVHVMSVDPSNIQSHASCFTSMHLPTIKLSSSECAQVKRFTHIVSFDCNIDSKARLWCTRSIVFFLYFKQNIVAPVRYRISLLLIPSSIGLI